MGLLRPATPRDGGIPPANQEALDHKDKKYLTLIQVSLTFRRAAAAN